MVRVDQHRLERIEEKPVHKFFVNAGVYVLEPEVLKNIEHAKRFDMPCLFNSIVAKGKDVSVFPVREYWLDLGKIEDFNKAQDDYKGLFF